MKYRQKPTVVDAEQWTSHDSTRDEDSLLNTIKTIEDVAPSGVWPIFPPGLCGQCDCSYESHGFRCVRGTLQAVCPGTYVVKNAKGSIEYFSMEDFEQGHTPFEEEAQE